MPFGRWVRGPYRDFARDMLDSEASQLARISNPAKLGSLLRQHVEGRQNHERVLWSLINLEIFLRLCKPQQVEELSVEGSQESRLTVASEEGVETKSRATRSTTTITTTTTLGVVS